MYKVNEIVNVIKTGEVKEIIDFETVCGIELYYMSDKTAYPVDEIISVGELREDELNEWDFDTEIEYLMYLSLKTDFNYDVSQLP
jgi:hypothetical protein